MTDPVVLTMQEALDETLVLAYWLETLPADMPLSVEDAVMIARPHRVARILRLLYSAAGRA